MSDIISSMKTKLLPRASEDNYIACYYWLIVEYQRLHILISGEWAQLNLLYSYAKLLRKRMDTTVMNAVIKLFQLKELYSYTTIMGTIYPHWSACLFFLCRLWSYSILLWCVLLNSESGAILMLLYLTSAPFFAV